MNDIKFVSIHVLKDSFNFMESAPFDLEGADLFIDSSNMCLIELLQTRDYSTSNQSSTNSRRIS